LPFPWFAFFFQVTNIYHTDCHRIRRETDSDAQQHMQWNAWLLLYSKRLMKLYAEV
jgi:hypothetical protein